MFPINEFIARFRDILSELDDLADAAGDESLEDLNAEFDDMLLAIADIRPAGEGWRDELEEALDDLDAVADDYGRLADGPLPSVTAPVERLRRTVATMRGCL